MPPHLRPQADPDHLEALEIYNLMGGLDWAAVPMVFGLRDVRDPEMMLIRLAIIRDKLSEPPTDDRNPDKDHRKR